MRLLLESLAERNQQRLRKRQLEGTVYSGADRERQRQRPYFPRVSYLNPERALSRFFAKRSVIQTERGCIEWIGGKDSVGYGYISMRGILIKASLVAWVLANGRLPELPLICHTCDNPPCVNAAHLFPGTKITNANDMVSKGRNFVIRKLSIEDVRQIRHLYSTGHFSFSTLGKMFGIHRVTASDIVSGERWGWLQ